MEIKIEPNRLANLSKRMLEHQNRAKNLQYSLERETGKISSILGQSEFPPPFSGQLSSTNDSIKETSKTVVHTLEYQAAWLSYFAHKASGADNVPLSLTQATAILAKYDDRFKDPGKTDGLDAGKLAKDAAGELTGVYDAQRALTGIDPATGEKISGWSRVLAGGMLVLGLTPIGKGVKAFKVMRTADKVIGVVKEGRAARRVIGSADVIKSAEKAKQFGKYSTAIDHKVKVIEKVDLPDWISESFTDSNYRTVLTQDNITFYRTYGGGAKANGSFVTTSPAGNRINAKVSTALVPDWKNSRQYEAVIEVPKGEVLNIGRVEKQYTKSGALLKGDGDQILLPQGWPSEWIKETRKVPSK